MTTLGEILVRALVPRTLRNTSFANTVFKLQTETVTLTTTLEELRDVQGRTATINVAYLEHLGAEYKRQRRKTVKQPVEKVESFVKQTLKIPERRQPDKYTGERTTTPFNTVYNLEYDGLDGERIQISI